MKQSTDLSIMEFLKALFSRQTPIYIKLIMLMAFLYLVMPADLIPATLGPLAIIDDAIVLALLSKLSKELLENHIDEQRQDPTSLKDVTPKD